VALRDNCFSGCSAPLQIDPGLWHQNQSIPRILTGFAEERFMRYNSDPVAASDVNMHKTNSFLKLNFQFVSISKRNELFYPYITMIETNIKTNSFKNH
jgi:hypothetical protein